MSSPAEFYHSLPPVTKFYGTACFLVTTSHRLGLLNPLLLHFEPHVAFKQLQIWRTITNFFFLGPFSMNFAITLLMLARYGVQLERSFISTAQFLWMIIVSMLTLLVISTGLPSLHLWFMGPILVFVMIYLWSREFPDARISLFGLVTIQGFYLPWALLLINVLFGGSLISDLLGVAVGHLYHFLTVLHPRSGGRDYLRAPRFIHKLVAKLGIKDRVPPPQPVPGRSQPQAQSQAEPVPERTAFRGRSYRLNRD